MSPEAVSEYALCGFTFCKHRTGLRAYWRAEVGISNVLAQEAKFQVTKRTYTQQFSHIYFCRLKGLLPAIQQAAISKWGTPSVRVIERILDMLPGEECIIYGTLFSDLSNKPNILKEFELDLAIPETVLPMCYRGDHDKYYLEDESGRVEVLFKTQGAPQPITGMCCALRGAESEEGIFLAEDYCYAGMAPQNLRPVIQQDKYLALISGLESGLTVGGGDLFSAEMLFDFLMGNLPGYHETQNIVMAYFVGNSLCRPRRVDDSSKKKYGTEHSQYDLSHLSELDQRLALLAQSMSVVVMPGRSDPTGVSIPQQAINQGLLPTAASLSTFRSSTNPTLARIDGIDILLCSGQNIEDMCRYGQDYQPLAMASLNLHSRHIFPTAPDTLWCFPFYDRDPFIIETCPHVYIVGNQPVFQSTVLQEGTTSCRIILVPKFSQSRTIVLLNLRDLSCHPVKFP